MRGDEHIVGTPAEPYDEDNPPGWVDVVVGTLWTKIYQNDPVAWANAAIKFDLVIVGKIYCNSDEVGGTTWHGEDPQELWNLYVKYGDDAGKAVQELLGIECEPVIYGFVVKEL